MARVNVEQSALSDQTDPRFKVLGAALGVDRWSALGRMCVVWNLCQERETYVLDVEIVNNLFADAPLLSEALLTSKLGKKHRHGIYISGSRGRVEWLANKRLAGRENGKKGGRPKGNGRKPIDNQHGLPVETPPALAPALALTENLNQKPLSPSETKKQNARALVEEFELTAKHREWAAKNCPGVPIDSEFEAWKDRERANGYTVGKPPGKPVQDPQAAFYTAMRNAVTFGTYAGKGLFPQKPREIRQAPWKTE